MNDSYSDTCTHFVFFSLLASLKFQPMKRPNVAQKGKPRPPPSSAPTAKSPENAAGVSNNANNIAKWTEPDDGDEDLGGNPYAMDYIRRIEAEKHHQRGGRNKKKKKANAIRYVDWDKIYDPERPTRLDDYHGSDEQIQAIHDWKMRLHAHQLKDGSSRRGSRDEEKAYRPKQAYAPPSDYKFVLPSDTTRLSAQNASSPESGSVTPRFAQPEPSVPPLPSQQIANDASGEDAYMRRLQLSAQTNQSGGATSSSGYDPGVSAGISASHAGQSTMPQAANAARSQAPSLPLPVFEPAPGTADLNLTSLQGPTSSSATISAAPVRYSQPQNASPPLNQDSVSEGLDESAHSDPAFDAPKSNRPGQRGFAERLLLKYGWKGKGLGLLEDGITTALHHQPEKRKKGPDSKGPGGIGSGNTSKIVGGKRQRLGDDGNAIGGKSDRTWSIVACFSGMLKDVDVLHEMQHGTLMQDIGNAMDRYGIVERLYLDREVPNDQGGTKVFAKFTSALSAYRAIQAGDGQDFLGNGRIAQAAFYDEDRFEEGVYS